MLLILILNGAINVLILQLFICVMCVCVCHHPSYLHTFSYCKNDSNFGNELNIVAFCGVKIFKKILLNLSFKIIRKDIKKRENENFTIVLLVYSYMA